MSVPWSILRNSGVRAVTSVAQEGCKNTSGRLLERHPRRVLGRS